MLEKTSILRASDDVSIADLDGEAVLLNLNTGQYFGLNGVGVYILKLLSEPMTVAAIIDALLQQYDVTPDALVEDVIPFLREMEEMHLVHVVDGVPA